MKEKIILFIGGLLLGTIISTGSIYVYTLVNNTNNNNNQMVGEMPNGNGGQPMEQNGDMQTPPEKPDGQTPNSLA